MVQGKMRLKTRVTFFSSVAALILILFLISVSLFSFRQFAIHSAEKHARTVAEIIRANLTESMVNGVIDKRSNLLDRMARIEGLVTARVIRSPHVSHQFGKGIEQEKPRDNIDYMVLESGKPHFSIEEQGLTPVFRSTIPFTASSTGDPNCMQCHQVAEGTVLGAVSLTTTTTHLQNSVLTTIVILISSILLFAMVGMLLLRRLIHPLIQTAEDVQSSVHQAVAGDFTGHIENRRDDEIGQIAKDINRLMVYLRDGLHHIQEDVTELIQATPESNGNMMDNTIDMVEGLIEAAHFKQAIEEDETTQEVYDRLSRVLQADFGVLNFTIYEVDSTKNQMRAVIVDGEPSERCHWCDANILVRPQTCRARRTGHLINSFDAPHICNAFKSEDGHMRHICLPVIQSGSVGGVVQLVADAKHINRIKDELAYLTVYLREAAPVIQGKRLMDKLHQSTLRDPMTGLHNRRFLEEYVDTLMAMTKRQKKHFTALMADMDFFKKVNDEYGHDVGDAVIKALAKTLVHSVRSSDLVIRFGGEEFLIILQETDKKSALLVAEKIRAAVEEMKVQVMGAVIQRTISIGIADYPDDSDTFWQIVKFADVALYEAKKTGRNKIISFTPELWEEEEHY